MRDKRSNPNEGQDMANIGKSISIKGDLTGNEDLVVEGKVEGKIALPDNELTVGNNGNVSADIHAKSVVVIGKVTGNVSATEKIEVQASGSVDGDVRAPRLIIQEGAVLNGAVEMTKGSGATSAPASSAASSPALSSIGKTVSSKG
jgi:cytoskeletal protein CcmA (bactofilin family)